MFNKAFQLFISALDTFTGYLTQVSGDERRINQGKAFSGIFGASLAGTTTVRHAITTPAGTSAYFHLRPTKISTSASPVRVKIYEDVSFTGGSAWTPINRNRNSATASTAVMKTGVTATPGAAVVIEEIAAATGGVPVSRAGGAGGADGKTILLPSKNYVVEIENLTAAATDYSIELLWHEEAAGV